MRSAPLPTSEACAGPVGRGMETLTKTNTTTRTTTTSLPDCPTLRSSCSNCLAAGCHYCEVGPEVLGYWERVKATEDQLASLDYACYSLKCGNLIDLRPATLYSVNVDWADCDAVVLPEDRPTETTTRTTITSVAPNRQMVRAGVEVDIRFIPDFAREWGWWHWTAILLPIFVFSAAAIVLYVRRRRRRWQRRRRIHVAPTGAEGKGKAAGAVVQWDFTQMGPLSLADIKGAGRTLKEANEDLEETEAEGVQSRPQRCILLGKENALKAPQLEMFAALLDGHPKLSLVLHTDWRGVDDKALRALASLLRRRERCRLVAPSRAAVPSKKSTKKSADAEDTKDVEPLTSLRLPCTATVACLEAVAEAVATGAHAEVDEVAIESTEASWRSSESAVININSLRLCCQDFVLTRHPLGNLGCAVACGFLRPGARRIQVIKLLECEIGDGGASALAQLLNGGPAKDVSMSLRDLTLSANRIGDLGATAIAEALPTCDALERLLIDRNRISDVGARTLSARLPRSNLRELVLGSHLGGNPLGPGGAEALSEALDDELPRAAADRAHRLQALQLEDCDIGERGAKALAAKLPKSAVTALSVARDAIGGNGAQALLAALPPCLVSLDLAGNGLSDVVASTVSEMLYKFPQLTVSVAQNRITPPLRELLQQEHGGRLRV